MGLWMMVFEILWSCDCTTWSISKWEIIEKLLITMILYYSLIMTTYYLFIVQPRFSIVNGSQIFHINQWNLELSYQSSRLYTSTSTPTPDISPLFTSLCPFSAQPMLCPPLAHHHLPILSLPSHQLLPSLHLSTLSLNPTIHSMPIIHPTRQNLPSLSWVSCFPQIGSRDWHGYTPGRPEAYPYPYLLFTHTYDHRCG